MHSYVACSKGMGRLLGIVPSEGETMLVRLLHGLQMCLFGGVCQPHFGDMSHGYNFSHREKLHVSLLEC